MDKMEGEVMTLSHLRCGEFAERLASPECLNGDNKCWCRGDHSYTIAILRDMGGFDLDASLEYFEKNGAGCDHEILKLIRGVK